MNWKYKGEELVRASGLQYGIIRAVGLMNTPDPLLAANITGGIMGGPMMVSDPTQLLLQPRKLDIQRGDVISGRIRRDELAMIVSKALQSSDVIGKTFEVRRDETPSGLLQGTNWNHVQGDIYSKEQDFTPVFRSLMYDADRAVGYSYTTEEEENGGEAQKRGRKYLPPFPYARDPFPALVAFPPPPPPPVATSTSTTEIGSNNNEKK